MVPIAHSVSRWRSLLDAAATVSIIAVCVAMIVVMLSNHRQPPTQVQRRGTSAEATVPSEPQPLEGAAIRGSRAARIAIIEYSDFQCPFCAKFTETILPVLDEEYLKTGRALLAFRHLPLEVIHPAAFKAALAAQCALEQNKFWEMHDALFADRKSLDDLSLRRQASALKVDMGTFDSCLSGSGAAAVRRDIASANALNVTGTPTFFVGELRPDGRVKIAQRISGAQSAQQFRQALDTLLRRVKPSGP